jgi:plasmid rolling circle replication initiator protein Rep
MSTEDSESPEYLTTASPSDASFDTHKEVSARISELYCMESELGFAGFMSGDRFVRFHTFGTKINECGNWLRFVKSRSGKIKLIDARFCKSPNCPMCQWRRSLKWRAKFLSLLPTLQDQHPKHRWLFLTLTVKNCLMQDLKQTIKHLNESFNRLSKLADFPFEGYIKAVEVTRAWECWDEQGNYLGCHGTRWIEQWEYTAHEKLTLKATDLVHPHLHIAGMVKASYFTHGYVSQSRWTEMWKRSLRVDYTPIVNVKAVKAKKLPPKPGDLTDDASNDESGMVKAICEVCKYTVKESDLIGKLYNEEDANQVNSEWLKALTEQLYRARRVEYRGILKEIGKELDKAVEDDDLIKIDSEEDFDEEIEDDIIYCWNKWIKKYIFSSARPSSIEENKPVNVFVF